MEIRAVVTKRLSNVMNMINSKRLLVLFGGCFLVLSLFYPPILTFSPIYMGMLVGYLSTKLPIISLLDLVLGYSAETAYFSMVYDFNFLLASHYGLTILGVNAIYGVILAVSIYSLLQRLGKPASWKTIRISSLLAATTLCLVGLFALTMYMSTKPERLTSTVTKRHIITVQAGDTCQAIAYEYNTSVENIIEWNGLTSECKILVGHLLYLWVPAK